MFFTISDVCSSDLDIKESVLNGEQLFLELRRAIAMTQRNPKECRKLIYRTVSLKTATTLADSLSSDKRGLAAVSRGGV